MLLPHPLDIVAILLGVFLLMRKSEVRRDDPALHEGVALADFEEWRRRALSAYTYMARLDPANADAYTKIASAHIGLASPPFATSPVIWRARLSAAARAQRNSSPSG